MINTLMIFRTFWTNMPQKLLAVWPRSQQSGFQTPRKKPNLSDDSLNPSRIKRKLLLTVQGSANKLPGVTYYIAVINENGDDPKKLWQVLRSALHRIPDKVIPSNSSKTKQLADQFASFFIKKISKIRVFFQFFILFLVISCESARNCQI